MKFFKGLISGILVTNLVVALVMISRCEVREDLVVLPVMLTIICVTSVIALLWDEDKS